MPAGERRKPQNSQHIVVLGATGSIGRQTLDVVERLCGAGRDIEIAGLSCGHNTELLRRQIESSTPRAVCVASSGDARALRQEHPHLRVLHGDDGLCALARLDGVDVVVNALVGAVGLAPTLAALTLGRTVALANKESLVVGGDLVRVALDKHGGRLFPLDSEHSAVFQCLKAGSRQDIARVILTASGGPFLRTEIEKMKHVSPSDALYHPNWSMGSRITIDSATMVNKAFEVIEAHFLFDLPYERIDAVVHPESIVHGLVEYDDGSMIAQLAPHDMRIPIQYALTYPERASADFPRLDFAGSRQLGFEPLDVERFPAFAVVLSAARAGGSAPSAVNAADEVLVSRFLAEEIPFTGIAAGLGVVLDTWRAEVVDDTRTLAHLLDVDRWARELAAGLSLG
jgi:1-deoxy-D-xylulose-5-phosphate reductoisomerase